MIKFPNKKQIFTLFLIILILINLIISVVIFYDIRIIESPKTDIEINVVEITENELVLEIIMKMKNPNNFDVSIEDFKILSMTENGDEIGELDIEGGVISSDESKTFISTDRISFNENSDFIVLNNKISGKIGVIFLGFIKKTIPIELNVITSLEEIINNIEIPDIDLEFIFDELTNDGLRFTAGVNILNENNIGITINDFALYAINDFNEEVGSFKIKGGEIKPNDNSFFNTTGVLFYRFIDTQELILSLSGDASLKIAGMNKSISLSTEISVILPDIQEFIFQNENIKFYIPVQFKLTMRGIVANVGFKYYNPSNISLFTRNINCSIKRVDGEKITQVGIEQMESCIIDPKQEVCIETEILIPYFDYLKAGNWRLIPNWIILTIEGDFSIAGTRQAVPLSLNAYVNPNIFKNQEFVE